MIDVRWEHREYCQLSNAMKTGRVTKISFLAIPSYYFAGRKLFPYDATELFRDRY